MDYITKLSKETDDSIHKYILLGLINYWERSFLINLLNILYLNTLKPEPIYFSEKQLKKLEEIYYKIDNYGFLFAAGEFLVNKHTGELALVYGRFIITDDRRLYRLQLCSTSAIIDLKNNYVESHYSLAEE